MSTAASIWSASAQSYHSYLAAQILSGFFSGVGQSRTLMWIKEIFFYHEHRRKINFWAGPTIVAPYIGPMLASFMLTSLSWHSTFVFLSILNFIAWLLIILFLDKPYFNRTISTSNLPPRGPRWKRLLGITQHQTSWQRTSFSIPLTRPFVVLVKIPVLLILLYAFINYAWMIGVNTTSALLLTKFYNFNPLTLGFFYFAAVIGVTIGQILGHFLHDAVGSAWAKRHNGKILPEVWLFLGYPASMQTVVSLVIIGLALAHKWHWAVVAVFYGAQIGAMVIAVTAVSAYLIDAYPEAPAETGAWLILMRTTSGFMASYIQVSGFFRGGERLADDISFRGSRRRVLRRDWGLRL